MAADRHPENLCICAATDPGTSGKHKPSDGTERAAAVLCSSIRQTLRADEHEREKELIISRSSTPGRAWMRMLCRG